MMVRILGATYVPQLTMLADGLNICYRGIMIRKEGVSLRVRLLEDFALKTRSCRLLRLRRAACRFWIFPKSFTNVLHLRQVATFRRTESIQCPININRQTLQLYILNYLIEVCNANITTEESLQLSRFPSPQYHVVLMMALSKLRRTSSPWSPRVKKHA